MRKALLLLALAAVVGTGLGAAGAQLFPRDAWSLGTVAPDKWDRVDVDRSARTAVVHYVGGYCSRFDHAETGRVGDYFVITVFERTRRLPKHSACPAMGVFRKKTVQLSEPIDHLPIVDGGCMHADSRRDGVCGTAEAAEAAEAHEPPCVLIDKATECVPSERLGRGGDLLRPLARGSVRVPPSEQDQDLDSS